MSIGVLGKLQVLGAFAALDRMNDADCDPQCGYCNGQKTRSFACSPAAAGVGAGCSLVSGACTPAMGPHQHVEICGHCEGSGLAVELGVAG